MTKEEAAELLLGGENPWEDCPTCLGTGQLFRRQRDLTSVTNLDTNLIETLYKRCPSCWGQGRYMPRAFKQAFKKLGMQRPSHPGPKSETHGVRRK